MPHALSSMRPPNKRRPFQDFTNTINLAEVGGGLAAGGSTLRAACRTACWRRSDSGAGSAARRRAALPNGRQAAQGHTRRERWEAVRAVKRQDAGAPLPEGVGRSVSFARLQSWMSDQAPPGQGESRGPSPSQPSRLRCAPVRGLANRNDLDVGTEAATELASAREWADTGSTAAAQQGVLPGLLLLLLFLQSSESFSTTSQLSDCFL